MQLQLYGKKIWLYREAIDFRCSIDGLSHLVVSKINKSPKDGIYLFFNRNRDKIKCLSWHKNGFVMFYKRIEEGRFKIEINKSGLVEMNVVEMSWLLAGLAWEQMREWQELDYDKFS